MGYDSFFKMDLKETSTSNRMFWYFFFNTFNIMITQLNLQRFHGFLKLSYPSSPTKGIISSPLDNIQAKASCDT
ncbi:hypothetical protein R50345_14925 [Paenibacillus sp. FSL R5-0345]|nr:hypothetical protein R50345_14925 [Paenibacillus sp. FSL R5-0345]